MPSFTAAGDPVLCSSITLDLANSAGTGTTGALFLGVSATDQATVYDGHLLVLPTRILLLPVPAPGVTLSGVLPCDGTLCGRSLYLQAVELDSGSSKGIAFTRGLRLVLGSQ